MKKIEILTKFVFFIYKKSTNMRLRRIHFCGEFFFAAISFLRQYYVSCHIHNCENFETSIVALLSFLHSHECTTFTYFLPFIHFQFIIFPKEKSVNFFI